MNLTVIKGDITKVHADVIVNAANCKLRGGGGVDGAIHAAAGPELLAWETWMYPHGTKVGVPVASPAFDLPAKHIIHVPGPDVRALYDPANPPLTSYGQSRLKHYRSVADEDLFNAYARSVVLAGLLGAGTVTFPSLSTGIFGFPLDRAVPLALDGIRLGAGRAPSVHTVAIVAFDAETFGAFREGL